MCCPGPGVGSSESEVLAGPSSAWKLRRRICSWPFPASGGHCVLDALLQVKSQLCGILRPRTLSLSLLLSLRPSRLSLMRTSVTTVGPVGHPGESPHLETLRHPCKVPFTEQGNIITSLGIGRWTSLGTSVLSTSPLTVSPEKGHRVCPPPRLREVH